MRVYYAHVRTMHVFLPDFVSDLSCAWAAGCLTSIGFR